MVDYVRGEREGGREVDDDGDDADDDLGKVEWTILRRRLLALCGWLEGACLPLLSAGRHAELVGWLGKKAARSR